jgi:phosphate transport system substrate-binding protein
MPYGCGQKSKIIQIKGSDTMVNMAQSLVEEFAKIHPQTYIAITGGGSGTGVAALISGTSDISLCSRDMTQHEIGAAREKGVEPHEIHVASDGIAVVVSPSNPLSRLTKSQLADIFSGKITSWKQLGGPDRRIVALSRDRNSGTHVFFLEEIVKRGDKKSKEEFASSVLMMPSTQAIVEEVSANPEAIGYIGLGYACERIKILAISRGDGHPFVLPTVKTASSGQYPVSRTMFFYTNGVPEGDIKEFVDFTLSPQGQKVIIGTGFVPLGKQ